MGRGGATKLNHSMILQAVDDVLRIYNSMSYDFFKQSVVLRYIELSRTAIMNRGDWQHAWKRCARTALRGLNQYDEWVIVKYRVLTDTVFEGNKIIREETAIQKRGKISQ